VKRDKKDEKDERAERDKLRVTRLRGMKLRGISED
jgi:hypothetical protein